MGDTTFGTEIDVTGRQVSNMLAALKALQESEDIDGMTMLSLAEVSEEIAPKGRALQKALNQVSNQAQKDVVGLEGVAAVEVKERLDEEIEAIYDREYKIRVRKVEMSKLQKKTEKGKKVFIGGFKTISHLRPILIDDMNEDE